MKIVEPKYQNIWDQTLPDSICEKFANKLAINRRHDFTGASFLVSRIRWNTERRYRRPVEVRDQSSMEPLRNLGAPL